MFLNRTIKKFISILLLFTFSLSIYCYSEDTNSANFVVYNKDVYGEALFAMESNSGLELYGKNENKKMFPASITKIMTVIVVLDNVVNLDNKVNFSYNAVTKDIDRNTTTIGASAGDVLSVAECLYCALLPSANDVANALAEYVAGNISDFTLLMNEKASKLGMTNTHFSNPSGLQDENNYTTAKDIAIMLKYAMTKNEFRQIIQTSSFKHSPIRKYKNPENSNNTVLNTNSLILKGNKNYYQYAIGGKTGYTKDAGYTLAAVANKNGMEMIVVVLGCKKNDERFDDFKNICNFYFDNYKSYNIREFDPIFKSGFTDMSIEGVILVRSLQLTVPEKASITIPKDVKIENVVKEITYEVEDTNNDNAIGTVKYYCDYKLVGSCSLLGLSPEEIEDIHTAYLNISQQDNESINENNKNSNRFINKDRPIYRTDDGKIAVSLPILSFFQILIFISIVIIFVLFFRSKYFIIIRDNINAKIVSYKYRFKNRKK